MAADPAGILPKFYKRIVGLAETKRTTGSTLGIVLWYGMFAPGRPFVEHGLRP